MKVRFRGAFAAVTAAVVGVGALVDCGDDDVAIRPDAGAVSTDTGTTDAVGDALDMDAADLSPAPCFGPTTPRPSGSLDLTFGTASGFGGYARANIPFGASAVAHDIAIDSRGRIVVAVTVTTTNAGFVTSRMAIIGWDAKGDVDRRFGAMGLRDLGVPSSTTSGGSEANTLTIGTDDRIVIGGASSVDGRLVPTLVQLGPDGGFDTAVGLGGVRSFSVPVGWLDGNLGKVRISGDGRIVATGSLRTVTDASGRFAVALVGLKPNPENMEIVEDDAGLTSIGSLGLVLADSGATALIGRSDDSRFLLRFVPGSGASSTTVPTSNLGAVAFEAAADDKFLVAFNAGYQFGVARIGIDGSLDPTFADAGAIAFGDDASTGSQYPVAYFPSAVLRHSNGFIYVVGELVLQDSQASDPKYRVVLARLTANGTVDKSFGQGGFASVPDGAIAGFRIQTHGITEDRCRGRIIVAGRVDVTPAIFAFWP